MSLTFSGCNLYAALDCFFGGNPFRCDEIFDDGEASRSTALPEASGAAKGKTIRYRMGMAGAIPDRGTGTKNGTKTSVKGVTLVGAFSGGVLPSKRASASKLDLARFKKGSWYTLLNMSGDSRTKKGGAKGTALATFTDQRGGQMCLRLKIKFRLKRGKPKITGTFKSTGGTGDAAKAVAKGSLKYKERPNGTFSATGKATYSEGSARPLPPACQKIKQKFGLP